MHTLLSLKPKRLLTLVRKSASKFAPTAIQPTHWTNHLLIPVFVISSVTSDLSKSENP